MEHDSILNEQSEEKAIRLLDKEEVCDFWHSFQYLKKKIGLTDLQSFSVCIRKFGLRSAFNNETYISVRYLIPDRIEEGINGNTIINNDVALRVYFQRRSIVPEHLRKLYDVINDSQADYLTKHLHRLTYQTEVESSVVIDDFFVTEILRLQAQNPQSRTGRFKTFKDD
jgi:hypothetical protein